MFRGVSKGELTVKSGKNCQNWGKNCEKRENRYAPDVLCGKKIFIKLILCMNTPNGM